MIHKISVPDMHCENCVKRINSALNQADVDFKVDLETKTVTVDGCEKCLNITLAELEDLGFTPEKL